MPPETPSVTSFSRIERTLLASAATFNPLATTGALVAVISQVRAIAQMGSIYVLEIPIYWTFYGPLVAINLYAFVGVCLSFSGVRPPGVVIMGLITAGLVFIASDFVGPDWTRYGWFLRALAAAGALLSAALAIVASLNARTNRSDAD